MSYDDEILAEIDDFLDVESEHRDRKRVPIIFDGNQYTIKIPKKIAEKANIGKNDQFEFKVIAKLADGKRTTVLKGNLVNEKEETS